MSAGGAPVLEPTEQAAWALQVLQNGAHTVGGVKYANIRCLTPQFAYCGSA